MLEPLIVEHFIENAPDDELQALKAHSEVLKKAYLGGNAEEIVAAKRDFYDDRICTGARNLIAFDLLKKLTLLPHHCAAVRSCAKIVRARASSRSKRSFAIL